MMTAEQFVDHLGTFESPVALANHLLALNIRGAVCRSSICPLAIYAEQCTGLWWTVGNGGGTAFSSRSGSGASLVTPMAGLPFPEVARQFINLFDRGKYPELMGSASQ